MAKKVIIIGAGPGGLATAMLLASAGLDVQVLERQPSVGGRTSSIESSGFRFDLGPTFFLYPEVLEEIFAAVGRQLRVEVPMTRLDPQYRLIFGAGGELNCRSDVDQMVAEISRLAPADAGHFRRFIDDNRVKLAKFKPCLQSPFLGWSSLMQMRLLAVLPYLKPWKSLHAELASYFSDPRLQLAFTFQSKYLGMSPYQCPSLFSILSFIEYEYGIFHPTGGCAELSRAMARVATELNARISCNEPVEEIKFSGRRAVGVRTARHEYPADAIVLNADFGHAITKLVPERLRPKWSDAAVANKRFSCSTFMIYLGIEGRYDHLAHHNIYISADYRRNLEDIELRHHLTDDPSIYVQNAGLTDPTLAPAGHSTLYVLAPVSHQHANIDWSKKRSEYRGVVMKQLSKLGMQDLESRIRFERIITPQDWEQSGIYRGATFNLAHNLGQMLHFRPQNRFEELDGVYLVGGGTHPGSGLPVIFESARISTGLLLQDLA